MCIHEGGLAFVKKNCEILWWNNFHFCHIVFIVHSWLGIEGFLSFVWCRCCGAESCFRRRLYFPTLLLTITRSREGGSPVETKDVCPQVIWPWFIQEGGVSSQWWKEEKKAEEKKAGGREEDQTKLQDKEANSAAMFSECQAWAVASSSPLSPAHSCCSWGSIIFTLGGRRKQKPGKNSGVCELTQPWVHIYIGACTNATRQPKELKSSSSAIYSHVSNSHRQRVRESEVTTVIGHQCPLASTQEQSSPL